MSYSFRENYWDDEKLKREFIRFVVDIHNLDLSLWNELGYWDNLYRPFSFFDGDRLISNLCLYSMDMVVDGTRCMVAQISAVGTHPDYRRQGLSKKLNDIAVEWAKPDHDFFYLFADDDALGFYKKCGFRSVPENYPIIKVEPGVPEPGIEMLDLDKPEHRQKIYEIASARTPVSNKLGILNPRLFMFWALNLKYIVFFIPKSNLLVLCGRDVNRLIIYDIVGQSMPPFSDIYPYIRSGKSSRVEFLFMTDRLGLTNVEYVSSSDNGLHLMGDFPLDNIPFCFPFTSMA